MSHLSPAELVDAVEGVPAPARAAHLESCAACRDEVARVTAALTAVHHVEVPEPSPLYWGHMAARVRAHVADERILPAWRSGEWWPPVSLRLLVPVASAIALAGAVIVSGIITSDGRVAVPAPPMEIVTTAASETGSADDSEAWQMLTSAAAETPIEDAHAAGMAVAAGAIDRAVQRMTPEELDALGQLLRNELRGSGE